MRPWYGRCHRCGKESMSHQMSIFNTDLLCPACLDKERKHPDYKAAQDAETAACMAGNYNFCGIGKPADL